jgi:hypothetical protein
MVVDGVNSHVSFLRDLSRQINGLRRTRPTKKIPSASNFHELHLLQKLHQLEETRSGARFDHEHDRDHVIDTYASIPCLSCAQIDEEAGLVCETCDRVQHVKCMSTCPREACPEGDWYCEECRLLPAYERDAPCVACGVLDGTSCEVRCDRCAEKLARAPLARCLVVRETIFLRPLQRSRRRGCAFVRSFERALGWG